MHIAPGEVKAAYIRGDILLRDREMTQIAVYKANTVLLLDAPTQNSLLRTPLDIQKRHIFKGPIRKRQIAVELWRTFSTRLILEPHIRSNYSVIKNFGCKKNRKINHDRMERILQRFWFS